MPAMAGSLSQVLRRQAEFVVHTSKFVNRPGLSRPLQTQSRFLDTRPRVRFFSQKQSIRHTGTNRIRTPFLRTFFQQRFSSAQAQTETLSLSQRLKKLSREYGWAAVGVYFSLSILDFPFCFAAVRLIGVDRIGHFEHVVVEGAKNLLKNFWPFEINTDPAGAEHGEGIKGHVDGHGVEEARRRSAEEGASIWTQLALAYAIHKSFIFLRVPLAAAVTPKVVKTLRKWGWNIGKRAPKGN